MGKYKIIGISAKKKNNLLFMLLVLFLISAILCISSFGIATWARYRSIVGNNVEAQIAKWSFKVNGEEEQFADINLADTIAFTNVEKTTIAPGTYGSFDLDIDGSGSEVSLDYYIDMVIAQKPTNMKFYLDSNYTQAIEIAVGNKMYLEGDLLLSENPMRETRIIYWKWDYRTNTLPSEAVLNAYSPVIPGLEALITDYNNATGATQEEIAMKINDKIDTQEEGSQVIVNVKVRGVQINPNFSLKRVQVTSVKDEVYEAGDTVNFSMEFTENVYADDGQTAVDGLTAPVVTVGFGTMAASNPVAKVASLINTNLKLSAGEKTATFVSASGNKINYSYTLQSGDSGAFRIASITGSVYNRDRKQINFGTVQSPTTSVPEVIGGTITTETPVIIPIGIVTPVESPTAIPTPEATPTEVNSNELVLYDRGNKCVDITGGWEGRFVDGDNPGAGTTIEGNTYFEINTWGTWCAYGFISNNEIDFSGYSNIVFVIEEAGISNGYSQVNYGLLTNCRQYKENINSTTVLRYDISSISSGKVQIGAANGATVKCSKIYLEK